MNSYNLTRKWFDFAFENVDKVKSQHTALYVFAVEHNNRLGWKEKFQLPTAYAMECTGIGTYKTYINALNDLIKLGFIEMIKKSKNQYTANIIALVGISKTYIKQGLSGLDKVIISSLSEESAIEKSALVEIAKAQSKHNQITTKAELKQDQSTIKAELKQSQSRIKAEVVKNNHIPYTKNQEPKTIYYRGVIENFLQNFENAPLENKNYFFNEILKRKDFKEFLKQENFELSFKEKPEEKRKEKSSAKKEKKISKEQQEIFKKQFLELVSTYYWQVQDDKYLIELLQKLSHLIEQTGTSQTLTQTFKYYMTHLPTYWQTKKLTLENLSKNYNEIINEIKQNYEQNNAKHKQDKNIRRTDQDLYEFARDFGK